MCLSIIPADAQDQGIKKITTEKVDIYLNRFDKKVDSEIDSAVFYLERSFDYSDLLQYKKGLIKSYMGFGYVNFKLNKNTKAYEQLHFAIEEINTADTKDDFSEELLNTKNLLGNVSERLGFYEEAMKNYLEALYIAQEKENRGQISASALNAGKLYDLFGQHLEAIRKYRIALQSLQNTEEVEKLAEAYSLTAGSYLKLDRFNESLSYADSVLQLNETNRLSNEVITKTWNLLGETYFELNNIEQAVDYFKKAIEMADKTDGDDIKAETYSKYTELLTQLNEIKKAKQYLDSSLTQGGYIENQQIQSQIFLVASEIMQKQGRYQEALDYLNKSKAISDSIQLVKQQNAIVRIEKNLEEKLKEKEENVKKAEEQLAQNRNKYISYLLAIASTLVLVLAASIITVTRKNRKIKRLNTSLEAKVKKRTKDLEDSKKQLEDNNQKLEKANNELDRFVYSASHDLRSPLANIQGLLRLALGSKDRSEVDRYLHLMDTTSKKMDALIADLVNYSKNERIELKNEKFDITQLISESLESISTRAEGVTIDTSFEGDSPIIQSDKLRIGMVISNLVNNAINYRDKKKEVCKVFIAVKSKENQITLSVSDNGLGISKEHQEKIYNMYYRAHPEDSEGTGLGLYIVKDAIHKLNGKISLKSKVGRGSTFTVSFPNMV